MQLELSPKQQAILNRLETETGKSKPNILSNIINEYLEKQEYKAWASKKIQAGIDDLDNGRCLSHEDCMAQLRAFIREKAGQE